MTPQPFTLTLTITDPNVARLLADLIGRPRNRTPNTAETALALHLTTAADVLEVRNGLHLTGELATLHVGPPDSPLAPWWGYERLAGVPEVRAQIARCEGRHVQQVAFSSFMDALTQVCFTERVVRSSIEWEGARSWTPGQ